MTKIWIGIPYIKSHCEAELTSYEDCEKGVNVILETVMLLLSKE
jgi:N-carbamoyl-L-amino-acid hydrolase